MYHGAWGNDYTHKPYFFLSPLKKKKKKKNPHVFLMSSGKEQTIRNNDVIVSWANPKKIRINY